MGHHVYTIVQSNTIPLVKRFRAPVILSALSLLIATTSAKAACEFPQKAPKTFAMLPVVAQSQDDRFGDDLDRDHEGSIVGLWHTTYVNTDGSGFQSFKFWHPDGTEWESSSLNGICLGVWRETRRGTIRLHHVAWTFDKTNTLTGTLTIDEVNTVAPDSRTYTGTHTVTFFDLNGNELQQLHGTHSAKRITVDSTGAP